MGSSIIVVTITAGNLAGRVLRFPWSIVTASTAPTRSRCLRSGSHLRDRYCFYLALLPSGLFLRALAPSRGFDLRPYLKGASDRVFHPERGQVHQRFRTGTFEIDGSELRLRTSVYLGGGVHEQRSSLRVPAPHVLVGPGEVYWLTVAV